MSIKSKPGGGPGWVYIMSNPSMPGLLKIGVTQRKAKIRAKELSSATGVPTPFVIEFTALVEDPYSVESSVHRALSRARVNGRREFFRVKKAEARAIVVKFSDRRKSSGILLNCLTFATVLFLIGLAWAYHEVW